MTRGLQLSLLPRPQTSSCQSSSVDCERRPARMSARRVTRRQFVRAIGATLALAALSAEPGSVRAARNSALPGATPGRLLPLNGSIEPPVVAQAAINVWAATTGGLAAAVADLPPRVYVPHEL